MGLDGVEIVMSWEECFGVLIPDAAAAAIRTPRMATEFICMKLAAVDSPGVCLSQRAFYRLRRAFRRVLACPRATFLPQVRVANLVPLNNRRRLWQLLAVEAGVDSLPKYPLGWLGKITFSELTRSLVARSPDDLRDARQPWTRSHVREVVRAIITDHLGIPDFSDDADFVYDLRVD